MLCSADSDGEDRHVEANPPPRGQAACGLRPAPVANLVSARAGSAVLLEQPAANVGRMTPTGQTSKSPRKRALACLSKHKKSACLSCCCAPPAKAALLRPTLAATSLRQPTPDDKPPSPCYPLPPACGQPPDAPAAYAGLRRLGLDLGLLFTWSPDRLPTEVVLGSLQAYTLSLVFSLLG